MDLLITETQNIKICKNVNGNTAVYNFWGLVSKFQFPSIFSKIKRRFTSKMFFKQIFFFLWIRANNWTFVQGDRANKKICFLSCPFSAQLHISFYTALNPSNSRQNYVTLISNADFSIYQTIFTYTVQYLVYIANQKWQLNQRFLYQWMKYVNWENKGT